MPRDRAWRRRVVLAAACALAVPAGIGAFTFVYVDPSAPTRVRLTRPLLVRGRRPGRAARAGVLRRPSGGRQSSRSAVVP